MKPTRAGKVNRALASPPTSHHKLALEKRSLRYTTLKGRGASSVPSTVTACRHRPRASSSMESTEPATSMESRGTSNAVIAFPCPGPAVQCFVKRGQKTKPAQLLIN
jgi:hypothetical protein